MRTGQFTDYATAERQRFVKEYSTFPRREHIEQAAKRHGKVFKCGPKFLEREVISVDGTITVAQAERPA